MGKRLWISFLHPLRPSICGMGQTVPSRGRLDSVDANTKDAGSPGTLDQERAMLA